MATVLNGGNDGEEQTDGSGEVDRIGDGQGESHGESYGKEGGEGRRGGEKRTRANFEAGGIPQETAAEDKQASAEGASLVLR